ncbi:RlpA-like double-psi beta-barrel-protein domain-containing protein-containing protein [Sphaerosporella brunnea]|uniref:Cellulase n=1 Tax=Sphaerosporella brunnea TaxID=1250544 RepID=A0A5J5F6F0_9PEZI|nr:RlpA-like double-psi beta-barrel-protein domain-containing protein-containing protein [Sphaerosporella brunnea]
MHAFTALLAAAFPLLTYSQTAGVTTRYWDCCKGSCSWPGKAAVSQPVNTCDINNNVLSNFNTASACTGGTAYMCANQSPWAVNDNLSYGFAAVKLAGQTEADWCCSCYQLTFTSGPVAGKQMIVQATNTGADLGNNHFDIAIPGGGVGIYNACTSQCREVLREVSLIKTDGAPPNGWGAQYGGISSRSQCDSFPAALKAGCYWRFDWFQGVDNPNVTFQKVPCPSQLTALTGCTRNYS